MKKTLWKFGLIGGVIMSALFALSVPLAGDPPDYATMEIVGYASILLSLLAVFFGIKSYRDRQPGGRLTFGTGMLLGIGISAVASLVLGLYTFAHIAWFDPGFGEKYSAWEKTRIEASDATPDEKAAQIQQIDELLPLMNNPVVQGLIMFATVLLIGIVISLISTAILKRGGGGAPAIAAGS